MSRLKELELLAEIHYAIKYSHKGNPQELANNFGISRSSLYTYLEKLKDYGAEINYCKQSHSFRYANDFRFKITIETNDMQKVLGGTQPKNTYFKQLQNIYKKL